MNNLPSVTSQPNGISAHRSHTATRKQYTSRDDMLRIKVTGKCQFQCDFCHQEGSAGSGDLKIDNALIKGLGRLYHEIKLSSAHITGGEPTLYPHLVELIGTLKHIGFEIKMTTNGQFNAALLKDLKEAGLTSINFSIHSLDTAIFCKMQNHIHDENRAMKMIQRQLDNVREAKKNGLQVKVNTVVGNDTSIHDVTKIKEFCMENGIEWRILTNWNQEEASIQWIKTFLESTGAVRKGANMKKIVSPNIMPANLPGFETNLNGVKKLNTLCGNCKQQGVCKEWICGVRISPAGGTPQVFTHHPLRVFVFAASRIYGNNPMVRLCRNQDEYPAAQTFDGFFESEQYRELSPRVVMKGKEGVSINTNVQ